jgi:ankyrin repeat protein
MERRFSNTPKANLELQDKLLHLSLVNSLTENNTEQVLASISNINNKQFTRVSYGSPLHLVVSLSEFDVVMRVIQSFCKQESNMATAQSLSWVNIQNDELETPVHIASKMGRLNVLQLLFDLTQIDDTKRQSHGKTPMDVAKDDKTTEFFKRQTEDYIAAVTTAMKNAIDWGDHHAIETFFVL